MLKLSRPKQFVDTTNTTKESAEQKDESAGQKDGLTYDVLDLNRAQEPGNYHGYMLTKIELKRGKFSGVGQDNSDNGDPAYSGSIGDTPYKVYDFFLLRLSTDDIHSRAMRFNLEQIVQYYENCKKIR